jgi:hypothetical protein
MKFLIIIFLLFLIIPANSQEIDKLYYILGFSEDLSFPLHYQGKLKAHKRKSIRIHENDLGRVYRFAEVTGFKSKKSKAEKDCFNCHQFYIFTILQSIFNSKNFYDFKYSIVTENYFGFGEVEEEKSQAFLKPNILTNATQLQMKSFLAGAYLDSGSIKGDTIKFEYQLTQNQKLIILKDFISKIDEAKFFSIIERKNRPNFPAFSQGQTVVLVPNKVLLDLFRNEEERKKALLSSFNISN